ncbi:hypothetical protein B0A49_03371 [Cryomyces minteri]|uniref:HTH CENPB-type domain-containing protein n=1 Tax=Cryomyces minteri TaxID=331657 RepID=A0A4U0X6C6_9PEZI|nr:hypothetical protein B0A49_03371 [Cryomyces minteri]
MPPPPPGIHPSRDALVAAGKEFAKNGYELVIGHSARSQGEPSRANKLTRTSSSLSSASKKRFEDGWMMTVKCAEHNHEPVTGVASPGASPWPELEEALSNWRQACLVQGIKIHGNTIKAKAIELWGIMPTYYDSQVPGFGSGWLDDYRRRHGFSARTIMPVTLPKDSAEKPVPQDAEILQYSTTTDLSRQDAETDTVADPNSLSLILTDNELMNSVKAYVREYMSLYDASHDYNHVLRVLALSTRILSSEQCDNPTIYYDTAAVSLAALLHDVGDHKYVLPDQDASKLIAEVLFSRGASTSLADKVQCICTHVSYSVEIRNPLQLRKALSQHPELAIVQDADRLDAIGAVGIGRAFTFGGAKQPDRGMRGTIEHFTEKLERLEGMMKTQAGRRLARERTEKLRVFRTWWEEEDVVAV